ncbi:MAG TPA: hypothetical protein VMU89_02990 [Thermomicrobiaceae bacterium]|nr:hypothetical protein [Thermomicrobiaceae bacterium]
MSSASRDPNPPPRWVVGTVAVLGAPLAAASGVPRGWVAALASNRGSDAEPVSADQPATHRPEAPPVTPGSEPPPPTHETIRDEERLAAHAFHTETPTYWPAALALGVMLVGLGIVTGMILSVVGGLLLVVALIGWIGELLNG